MLKRLILCHNINKFYKIFGDVLGFHPVQVRPRDLSNDDLIMSVGFDIFEMLEALDTCFTEQSYQMSRWLDNLYKEIMK